MCLCFYNQKKILSKGPYTAGTCPFLFGKHRSSFCSYFFLLTLTKSVAAKYTQSCLFIILVPFIVIQYNRPEVNPPEKRSAGKDLLQVYRIRSYRSAE